MTSHCTIRSTRFQLCVALATSLFLGGCALRGYVPQPSLRVSMGMHEGQVGFFREGRFFPMGMLGSGVVEAVRGVPEAETIATAYRNENGVALGLTIGGGTLTLAGSVGGAFLLGSPVGLVLLTVASVGGLSMLGTGLGYALSAAPKFYDAINIYNDRVAPALTVGIPFGAVPQQPALPPPQASDTQLPSLQP